MTMEEAVRYIHGARRYAVKVGLSNMRRLLALVGEPHRRLAFVHVGGTNGKGSTCAMIESVLRAAGYRTGLYTSPYLEHYRERIRLSGAPIGEADFLRAFAPVHAAVEALRQEGVLCTTFEIGTAVALLAFAEAKVEIAVIEVGVGGLNDPTNVILPKVCALCAIGLDHMEILGSTPEAIAEKKAGIAKPGVPLVLHPQQESVRQVVARVCEATHAPLYALQGNELSRRGEDRSGQRADVLLEGWRLADLRFPLLGRHQLSNAAVSLSVLLRLREAGFAIPDGAVYQGFESVRWPGRLEWVQESPPLLLDGAHNAQGLRSLGEYLAEHEAETPRVLLCALLRDKATEASLDILSELAPVGVCTEPPEQRAWPAEELADALQSRGVRAEAASSLPAALERARALTGPDGFVLATGSLYFVGALRSLLQAGKEKAANE